MAMIERDTWSVWTSNSTACATVHLTPNSTWYKWNSTTASTVGSVVYARDLGERVPEPTAEERLAAEQRRREKAEAAEQRATELLMSLLTPHQQEQYAKDRRFDMIGEDGVRYRIKHGWSGNVEELDDQERPVARYCLHPRTAVPVPDNLAVQKLLLETDAKRFRQTANRTAIPRPQESACV